MAPGPFTTAATAAIAVLGLFSAPLVWDKIPTAPPMEAAKEVDSRKLKETAVKEPVASSMWGTATPQAAPEEVPSPTTTKAPAKAPTPAPDTKKAGSKEQAPPKAGAKSPFEEIAEKVRPYVQMAEEKVIAFDILCSGPKLREASGIASFLEKWGVNLAAVSAAKSVGMSSIAATAMMSLALVADFGLLALFLLWRLSKTFCQKADVRDKRVEAMQKKVAEAHGKSTSGPKGKKGAKTPPTSGSKKNGNGRKSSGDEIK